mmetsp:Transcript_36445/g.86559  ORF Transcript_36445/g.86559 Transcript_36445/m.86559 type:complete len:279 (+) Transcript_36445:96-932(+)
MKVIALVSGGKDSCFNMFLCQEHGHEIIALANLLPKEDSVEELDSFCFQTVGHSVVASYASCCGLPLFRRRFAGRAEQKDLAYTETAGDEVEDLFCLLAAAKRRMPEIEAVSSGAIASDYQRLRVEDEDVRERDRGRADQGGSARPRPQEAPREDPRRDGAPSQRALRDVRRQRLRGRRRVRDADAGLPPLHKGPNQARGDRGRCLLRARRLAGRDAEDPQVQPRAKRRRVLGGRVAGGGRDGRGAPLVPPSGAPPRPQRPPSGAGAVHLSRRVLLHA